MPFEERTIVDVREEMALKALDERYEVREVAAMFGVTAPTVRLWRARYREDGRAGLEDRSHAPKTCPHRTSESIEQLVLEERKRWGWGSKKILARLEVSHPELRLPRRSTIDAILSRHDLIQRKRTRPRTQARAPFPRRYDATEPGELLTMDFKGEFLLRNGKYCYPLTIVDNVSRYVMACEALDSTSFERSWPIIERVLRKHGLPCAVQSDNGPPFGAPNGKFSRLAIEFMSLEVQPVFSRPGRPQDNGRHERMHKDLKAATALDPAATLREQQKKFDEFMRTYNVERPHEGIAMQRPAHLYRTSPRPFPRKRRMPEYPAHFEVRKVTDSGDIKLHQQQIFVSHAFAGRYVALEPLDSQLWRVHFHHFQIGRIDETTKEFI